MFLANPSKKALEYNGDWIAIDPRFDKLITSLRTAVENGEGSLDKDAISFDSAVLLFRYQQSFTPESE